MLQISPGEIRAEGDGVDKDAGQYIFVGCKNKNMTGEQLDRHTFVPVPGQIFQQPGGQRLTFQCESGCTRCADQHSSDRKRVKCNEESSFKRKK